MEYYSQDGQDKFLAELFKNQNGGFFVDIGAFDGITFSNSYYLEKNKHWKGICLEPNPLVFEDLKKNRSSICLNCCIGIQAGIVEFLSVSGSGKMLSGILNSLDDKHLFRIDKEVLKGTATKTTLKLPVYPLKTILEDNNIKFIDYCNVDVEGGELNVLKSIDFSKVRINVFTIENNYDDKTVFQYLKSRNYRLIGKLGADEVYEYKSKRYGLLFKLKIKKIKSRLSILKREIIK